MMIHRCLQPHIEQRLEFGKPEVVLVNSNFNCGFYVNRDKVSPEGSRKVSREVSRKVLRKVSRKVTHEVFRNLYTYF